MARDDFTKPVVERLAKRVGMKCSFPECRKPTSGPSAEGGTTNIGVAAHITAASPLGPRYDDALTPDQRGAADNGIWLCQDHAKLIDDDDLTYSASTLRDWKETAEQMAALEAKGWAISKASPFPGLEKKAPDLIAEMRQDLSSSPLVREFVLLSKKWSYGGGSQPSFHYFYEEHKFLDSMMTIMEHAGAIYETTYNNVKRYNFNEAFVSFLIGEG